MQEIRHPEERDGNFDTNAETIQTPCWVCNPKDMDHTAPASLLLLAHLRELDNLKEKERERETERETVTRMTTKEEEDSVLDY